MPSSHGHLRYSMSTLTLLNMITANGPNPEIGPLRGHQNSGGYPGSTDVLGWFHPLPGFDSSSEYPKSMNPYGEPVTPCPNSRAPTPEPYGGAIQWGAGLVPGQPFWRFCRCKSAVHRNSPPLHLAITELRGGVQDLLASFVWSHEQSPKDKNLKKQIQGLPHGPLFHTIAIGQ